MIRSVILLVLLACSGSAQTFLSDLVDTEHAFAKVAEARGTKAAFLEYLASDGLLFLPDKVNGHEYWNARAESTGLLSWAPNFADVSANGILGYTTGNWEYRPKGKGDTPAGFGEFITVWQRQPDAKYRFVVDIGIGHDRPTKYSEDWITTVVTARDANERNTSAADTATGFFELATTKNAKKAYAAYASDEIRLFREGKMPFVGKKAALGAVSDEKGTLTLSKRSSFLGSADLAYTVSTYSRSEGGKVIEKGNYVQIWRLAGGKWRIVMDVFKPVP